jgi:hypothetical protein
MKRIELQSSFYSKDVPKTFDRQEGQKEREVVFGRQVINFKALDIHTFV